MQFPADTLNLKPPQPGRWGLPVVLALVAHALLMAALTWGVHWKPDEEPVSFEAELWSALPREAAPRASQPPPPPPPPPEPRPEPKPRPEPPPTPKPSPPPQPVAKQTDIATEKAKKKLEEDKKRAQEAAKKEKALKDQAEKEKKAIAEKKKAEEQKKQAEKKRQDQERQAAEDRKAEDAARAAREDQMRRIMGQAGATGGPEARGTAPQSSGPSSGYGARVAARIRPNIRYTEDFPRTLRTEIEVRATPDGAIIGRRVVGGSGNPTWDEAALKAIDRTASLPRDVDGRVPSPIIVVVRPTD